MTPIKFNRRGKDKTQPTAEAKNIGNPKKNVLKPNEKTLRRHEDKVWLAMVAYVEYAVKCGLLPEDEWESFEGLPMEMMVEEFSQAWEQATSKFYYESSYHELRFYIRCRGEGVEIPDGMEFLIRVVHASYQDCGGTLILEQTAKDFSELEQKVRDVISNDQSAEIRMHVIDVHGQVARLATKLGLGPIKEAV